MATLNQNPAPGMTRLDKSMRSDSSPAEINIGDVLRLALPIDATLIGGGVEARRYVNWIAILTTWEDFESQVEPNDLVIIPPNYRPN